jgi:CheY-like chemotaxis protein
MTIVGLAANGRQVLEMYEAHRPDVLLLDLRLPDLSGFDVACAEGMMAKTSRAILPTACEDCHGSRSPAIAALGEEAKDDYLLTIPTIRNAKAIVRSTKRQR